MPGTVYFSPWFCDQDFKRPNLTRYLLALEKSKPTMATAPDWEREEQLSEILEWAEEVAQYAEIVVIIPKVLRGIKRLPKSIGGKTIYLGYSVATSYGNTPVHLTEFIGWPVHLLGGCPLVQARIAGVFSGDLIWFRELPKLNVVSVDCNYHLLMATRFNQYFDPLRTVRIARNKLWPTLQEARNGEKWGDGSNKADAPYEAFRRSCENIMQMYEKSKEA